MLKIMRNKELKKKIIWVVAIIIIISFGFLGTAYLLNDTNAAGYAGKIYNKKINLTEFDNTYQFSRAQAIIRYGDQFQDIQQHLNLESDTWDRLILNTETKRRKIKVFNDEVVNSVKQYPFFQRNGQFDTLLYNDILRYAFRMKPRIFEEHVRDTIRINKLFMEVTKDITIPDTQIRETFETINEHVQISYVATLPEQFLKDVSVTESELKAYYDENTLDFVEPQSINVDYIRLPFPKEPETLDENSVIPDELKEVETAAYEAAIETIRIKANEIFEVVFDTADLSKAAEQFDIELQNSGFFSQENPPVGPGWSFDALGKIFELQKGEYTEPIETSDGILIAAIKDKKESFIPEFEEAKKSVGEALKQKKARTLAERKAQDRHTKIKQALGQSQIKDFSKVTKELGFDASQTPEFKRDQYLPKIGLSKEFETAAFDLTKENRLSDVVETNTGYYVLFLDSRIQADEKLFEEQSERIRQGLLQETQQNKFTEFMTKLRLEANLQSNFKKVETQ